MTGVIANHLWQSTAFAAAAGLLTAMLRRNGARVRYWVWLCASVKFLVPFSVLIGLGSLFPVITRPAPQNVVFTAVQIAEPFSQDLPRPLPASAQARDSGAWIPPAAAAAWACGFLSVVMLRIRGWSRVRAALRASVPWGSASDVEIRASPGLLEPGVVGLLRMTLLLPEGIEDRLTPAQLQAVLAHELSHVRRRDNLTSAIHMIVEALFWFHPLVWWIGARLIEERELACDEAVLNLGNEPRDYADAILSVVRLYVESPIVCVAGVTGANLKKRIEAIMNTRPVFGLNLAKKAALAVAGLASVALPIGIGRLSAQTVAVLHFTSPVSAPVPPVLLAQATTPNPVPLGGRGAAVTSTPSDRRVSDAEVKEYVARVQANGIVARYGEPDQIEDRNPEKGPPSQIWRYNYLADFHSNVEFEFSQGATGPLTRMHINWPPPTTYYGEPAIAQALVNELTAESQRKGEPVLGALAGFTGEHASMQTYPAAVMQTLVVPIELMLGPVVDVIGSIHARSSTGATGAQVTNFRDHIVFGNRQISGDQHRLARYTINFMLVAGSYVSNVAVKDSTGQIYSEAINFEVK